MENAEGDVDALPANDGASAPVRRSIRTLADLGPLIRARRKRLGLSQDDLADATDLSRRLIHSIEHGKPGAEFDRVMRVCDELGIRLEAGA